jgi:hypothetical protein
MFVNIIGSILEYTFFHNSSSDRYEGLVFVAHHLSCKFELLWALCLLLIIRLVNLNCFDCYSYVELFNTPDVLLISLT